jgi:glycosyltransferase involved in cell wall biosynthesis
MRHPFSIRLYCPGLLNHFGGAEKYTSTLAQFLADRFRDIDLGFVVYDPPGSPGTSADADSEAIKKLNARYALSLPAGIGITRLKEEAPGFLGTWTAHRRLRATSKGVDLYINCFHNVHYFHGRKNVHVVHFPAAPRTIASPTFAGKPWLAPLAAMLDARYRNCYDLFICNSAFTKSWLERYWAPGSGRTAVLHPPVAPERGGGNTPAAAGKENLILIVSRFDPRKKMKELLRYFIDNRRRFSGWRLALAGAASPEDSALVDEMRRMAEGLPVEIHENIPKTALDGLYARAAIFWHGMGLGVDEQQNPLDVEHFGITTVEAMAAGAVPVVIDKGGQREIVDDGVNGYRWTDLEGLGNATETLAANPTLRRSLSEAAIRKSRDYSVERFRAQADALMTKFRLIPEDYRK